MKILAIDDQELALASLVAAIKEARPSDEVFAFSDPSELLGFAKDNDCHIAFCDIEMWGMNGLKLALELKKITPEINIIFATAYTEYKGDAMDLRASGYVMKPVTKEAVEREIENLRHPVDRKSDARIFAQTFGNFDVFTYGNALKFSRSKTKELFAYLIDRNGASASTSELCALLWEDKQDSPDLMAYLRKLISDLTNTLRSAGLDDIIVRRHNSIAIVPEKIVCDSYGFMKGDPRSLNAYRGQYMAQYSWAEMTNGIMNSIQSNYKRN